MSIAADAQQSTSPEVSVQALVIDDSQAMRRILSRMLVGTGFQVIEASNGSEALKLLKQPTPIDLILVDWNMPVMNGIEFIRAVRSDSNFDGIRLMMVTTETGADEINMALKAGADEYVMKPFTTETITEKLRLLGFR